MSEVTDQSPEFMPRVEPKRGPGRLLPALIALVVGAGATFGGLYLAGWRAQPQREFNVSVFLKETATQQQKDAVQAALKKLPTKGDVHLQNRAEAYAEMKDTYARAGQPLPDYVTEQNLPESYRVATTGREFDCAPVTPLKENTGVNRVLVVMTALSKDKPGAEIGC
ncbi:MULTISPECIES: permease-like cell division protein FtsX [unclassified Actinoplanes]|uniref:permease-like cell division protein FtsX n=1 Tax=unclassified Actinoplanes TaxID=2626549 RepID=UPI0012BB0A7B|nr:MULTISPECIES: permease-like cell division protein FtsX [unclassified Actinoplanes]